MSAAYTLGDRPLLIDDDGNVAGWRHPDGTYTLLSDPYFDNEFALAVTAVIGQLDTSYLPESPSALYYTDARVIDAITNANLYFTDERAVDAVGAALAQSDTVDLDYDDPNNAIRANVRDGKITDAKLRSSAGYSVIGRAIGTLGAVADITVTADGQCLRRSGTALGFGALDLASANAVTGLLPGANISYNTSNLKVTTGQLNTIQNIGLLDSMQLGGLLLAYPGSSGLTFNKTNAGLTTTVRFSDQGTAKWDLVHSASDTYALVDKINTKTTWLAKSTGQLLLTPDGQSVGVGLSTSATPAQLFSVGSGTTTAFGVDSSGVVQVGSWGATAIVETKGGTNQTAYALGDTLYSSATNTLSKLAGNTTLTRKFLRQVGSGTVSAAPAWDTVTQADVGLSNVENTALSTWAGSTNLVTVGALTTGTWSATPIAETKGGTNQTAYTTGDLLQASATNVLSKLAAVAIGSVLLSGGVATASSWGKVGLTTHVSGVLPYANGGTNASTAWTAGSILFAGASAFAQDNANLFFDDSANCLNVGTATSDSNYRMRISSTKAAALLLDGTLASSISGTDQYGVANKVVFSVDGNTAAAFNSNATYAVPAGQTITKAVSFWANPKFTGNAGTIAQLFNFYFDGGPSGVGTIGTHYGFFVAKPLSGTTKISAYFEDISVGYTGVEPPINGLISAGPMGIGVSNVGLNTGLKLGLTFSTSTASTNFYGSYIQPTFTYNSGATTSTATGSYADLKLVVNTGASLTTATTFDAIAPTNTGTGSSITHARSINAALPSIGSTSNIAIRTANISIGYDVTPPTDGMIVLGKVAINRNSVTAGANLDVNGVIYAGSGESHFFNGTYTDPHSGTSYVLKLVGSGGAGSIAAAGNAVFKDKMSVGLISTADTLVVAGSGTAIRVLDTAVGSTVVGRFFVANATGTAYIGSQSNHPLALRVNDTDQVTVATTGYTGFGTTSPATKIVSTEGKSLTGALTDGYSAALTFTPAYVGAFTVTRHNYIDVNNVLLQSSAALTDACVMRFDAAAGTHKAIDSGTTKTSPGAVSAWMKININGTLYYIPAYTSKTS
jgi:hypothetical protein